MFLCDCDASTWLVTLPRLCDDIQAASDISLHDACIAVTSENHHLLTAWFIPAIGAGFCDAIE